MISQEEKHAKSVQLQENCSAIDKQIIQLEKEYEAQRRVYRKALIEEQKTCKHPNWTDAGYNYEYCPDCFADTM